LFFPENKKPPFSLIIICHGFKGNKEGDKYRIIANELAKKGIASFRFDFHGHGMSEGKFENFTLSQAMFDLKFAYDFLISQNFLDKNHFGIFGHSLACFIILLFLIKFSPKIKAQVLVSSVTDILDFKENWLRKNTKDLNEIDNWQKKDLFW
jgi:predicted alpha/beta-fold hydrolase